MYEVFHLEDEFFLDPLDPACDTEGLGAHDESFGDSISLAMDSSSSKSGGPSSSTASTTIGSSMFPLVLYVHID